MYSKRAIGRELLQLFSKALGWIVYICEGIGDLEGTLKDSDVKTGGARYSYSIVRFVSHRHLFTESCGGFVFVFDWVLIYERFATPTVFLEESLVQPQTKCVHLHLVWLSRPHCITTWPITLVHVFCTLHYNAPPTRFPTDYLTRRIYVRV